MLLWRRPAGEWGGGQSLSGHYRVCVGSCVIGRVRRRADKDVSIEPHIGFFL